ncbi:MAG: HD domain-containing protein [Bacteroidota bacterium]|nr:HD domain-containing protein [Bacteroidota bacterium]MDE2957031.1 HD domain-containing protein [Bacteroidota bacterium]
MHSNLTPIVAQLPVYDMVRTVGDEAKDLGIAAYAVGGFVRDALLGRPTADVDFLTLGPGSGIRLARRVGRRLGGRMVHVYENFGTAAVRLDGSVFEFVAARRESYRRQSRKPLVEDGSLKDDLLRRDFTINAMAMHLLPDLFGGVIDIFEGQADLRARRIRTPRLPDRTFTDDPLRMMRAARFAAQLDFRIAADALRAMRREARRLRIVSQERITAELEKIMACPVPSVGLHLLHQTGLLEQFFSELTALQGIDTVDGQRHKDNFYHTLQVLDNTARAAPDRYWLRWAALLHDIAKPVTKRYVSGTGWTFHGHEHRGSRMVPKLFRKLKLPTDERMSYVRKLVMLHHRPVALVDAEVTDSAVRRLLFEAGDDLEDLMVLVRADITSKNPRRVQRYLNAFDRVEKKFAQVEAKDHLRNFQPPVDGREIMEVVGLREGIAVGIIKERIREAILDGHIPNRHDAAFALMMEIKDDAVRRARLFEAMIIPLKGAERRVAQKLKQTITAEELPDDYEAALVHLQALKAGLLASAGPPGIQS